MEKEPFCTIFCIIFCTIFCIYFVYIWELLGGSLCFAKLFILNILYIFVYILFIFGNY